MLADTEHAGHSSATREKVAVWLREIPLYRDRNQNGAHDRFERLPLITKEDIRRDFPSNFLSTPGALEDLVEREVVELEHTSGTSEQRTPLILPVGWWREQEQRALRLNPTVARVLDEFPHARRVTISSPVCSGEISYKGVPSRSERTLGDSLYVSLSRFPFLWSEADLDRIVAEIQEWAPQFLDVDPVYGMILARHCERKSIRFPSLQFIVATYEFVSTVHRRILRRAFGVPVLDLYGSTETGHLMMESPTGDMRPSPTTAHFEVVNQDARGVGELIVTTLTNPFMPLIRYRIGDLVEQNADGGYLVHGRVMDALQTPNGRVTTLQVDRCFEDLNGFAHYQLIQRRQSHGPGEPREPAVLRFVPDDPVGSGRSQPDAKTLDTLVHRLGALLGQEDVRTEQHTFLMPESSGKFRLLYPGVA